MGEKNPAKPAPPRLDPIEADAVPSAAEAAGLSAEVVASFPPHSRIVRASTGGCVAIAPKADHPTPHAARNFTRVYVRAAGGASEEVTEDLGIQRFFATDVDITPDGTRAFLTDGWTLWRVGLETGSVDPIWRERDTDMGKALSMGTLDESRMLILTQKGLLIAELDGVGDAEVVHVAKVSKPAQLSLLPQLQCCAVRGTGATRLFVFAVHDRKLKKLLVDKTAPIEELISADGVLFAKGDNQAWKLMGLQESAAYAQR